MFYYLAYGSNLNLKEMKKRCPSAIAVGTSVIEGYKLVNRKYLNIEKDSNSLVNVGIFKIEDSDLEALDYYEDYPKLYHKEYFKVVVDNKEVEALIYLMNEGCVIEEPSLEYYNICLEGFKDFNFNPEALIKCFKESKR